MALTGLSVLPLSPVQDHARNMGVPPNPLPPLLRFLLLQWADDSATVSTHLLGRPHLAHGHQVPARECKSRRFQIMSEYNLKTATKTPSLFFNLKIVAGNC